MKIRTLLPVLFSFVGAAHICAADPMLAVVTRGDNSVNLYRARGAGLQLLKSIPVGKRPNEMCLDPNGKRLFIGQIADKSIAVIDLQSQSVVATMTDPALKVPDGCAVSADSSKLYVVDGGANAVFVFSTENNQLLTKIPVGTQPRRALLSKDGKRLLVTNARTNTISVIDTSSNAVVETVKTGNEPREMLWTPDGKFLAVSLIVDDSIQYFKADTLESVQQVGTERSPQRLAISDGEMIFSNSIFNNSVSIGDLSEHGERRLLASIPVLRDAWNMTISADGKYVYVAHTGINNAISVISVRLLRVLSVMPAGNQPYQLLFIK